MIEEILPCTVVAVDAFGDTADTWLFPEEEALVANAVERRRREFTTARGCARQALRQLGAPAGPLLRAHRGAPAWPAGVVGSITHCNGYRAAAVARERDILTIGLDAEPNEPLPRQVLDMVAGDDERAWIAERTALDPDVCWDRLLFSAKESVYKAWFPVMQRWLDFADATVRLDEDGGCGFTATVLAATSTVPDSVRSLSGYWMVRRGLVLTAISLPGTA
jgi:Phosphopantetheinyl transferase component of siderophore synthetase